MGVLSDLYSFQDLIINSDTKLLSTGEIALWYALKLFEDEKTKIINVHGKTLEKCTGLSHKGFYKARENLIRKRFIEYTADSALNKSGIYKFLQCEKVHTGIAANDGTIEKVHTGIAANDGTIEKVHTGTTVDDSTVEKVHTGIAANDSTIEKVHTGTAANDGTVEKVHTGTAANDGAVEKVHTGTVNFHEVFGVEDDIIKTNTFSKTSKMFARMIKSDNQE